MLLNLVLGLHMLLTSPKPGVALFETGQIKLHETGGIILWTSGPQLLLCKTEANKIHLEIFINFLDLGDVVGVV